MDKMSILLMDYTETCEGCLLESKGKCIKTQNTSSYVVKPDDCPLRPLPQKEICNEYNFEGFKNGVAIGYNRCLELITGEVVDYSKQNVGI